MLGSVTPRLWTPPLRELTPDTSYGFDAVTFARNDLGRPLDPWQEWLVIHAGELLPDGRPRFRIVLVLVARQNGKTELLVILTLFWQFIDAIPLILGTSTKLDYAKESWTKARRLAEKAARWNPSIADLIAKPRWTRDTNGEQESWTTEDSRYKIAASNAEGGRSLTIGRLILDELRQHHSYDAYDAAEPATSAVWDAQIWALSNAGDDNSVVLNDLRADALAFIETGEGDQRLGLFEWSAPENADPTDVDALAMANPNLGRRNDADALIAKAHRAKRAGGQALTGFKTENMCIRVRITDPAIDPTAWSNCSHPGTLDNVRDRVALCVDVAPDELHATVYAAAQITPDLTRIDFVAAFSGARCVDKLRRALPDLLEQVRPRLLGWYPNGPAASLAATLRARGRIRVETEEIKSELAAVCMGFAEQIGAERVAHSDDPLLNTQIGGAEKLKRGDTWVFSRRGEGHVDAVYAAAGAVHLARTLPPPPPRPKVIIGRRAA